MDTVKMYCYICGRICDKTERGLCFDCEREIAEQDERVMLYSLLNASQEYCPVWLRQKIEVFIERVNKKEPVIPCLLKQARYLWRD